MNIITIVVLIIVIVLPIIIPFLFISLIQKKVPRESLIHGRKIYKFEHFKFGVLSKLPKGPPKDWSLQAFDFLSAPDYFNEIQRLDDYFCEVSKRYFRPTEGGYPLAAVDIDLRADKSVVVLGGIDPNDWSSISSTFLFMAEILECTDKLITFDYNWYFFPIVNPDGFNRSRMENGITSWKGIVNLYMNFNSTHSEEKRRKRNIPANKNKGSAPFSEQESLAVQEYIESLENLVLAIVIMGDVQDSELTGSGKIWYPWSAWTNRRKKSDESVQELCEKAVSKATLVETYRCQNAGEEERVDGTLLDWLYTKVRLNDGAAYTIRPSINFKDFEKPELIIKELADDATKIIMSMAKVLHGD